VPLEYENLRLDETSLPAEVTALMIKNGGICDIRTSKPIVVVDEVSGILKYFCVFFGGCSDYGNR